VANRTNLLEISEQVSDGRLVDWAAAERGAESEEARRVLRNLRLVASLASVHRSATDASGEAATIDSAARAAAPDAAAETSFRWGALEVRERIGEGAAGEVYRAWDQALEREVALKLLKPAASGRAGPAARVLHEGRLLARVRHANVVVVHGADVHDGRVGLAMELVRGRSLAQIVERSGTLGAREAALVGADVCRALAAVHRAGLVHRDVKAANVMREEGGRVLLMDFGIGSGTEAAESSGFSGTPLYIAPEIYAGEKATPRSDLYSVGVLLYYLVTGRHPIEAATLRELRAKMARREARMLRDERPDLPEAFVRTVERALAFEPAARFATAGEMEAALTAALGRDDALAAHAARTSARIGSRRTWIAALLALAAAATLVAVVVHTRSAGEAAAPATAGPPPAVPAPPVAIGAYTVGAQLVRVGPQGAREPLLSGGRLALGDQLALELRASRPVHAYVIAEDDHGRAFVLFPLPGATLTNPLPAGATHTLPGRDRDGKPIYWRVDTTGGREHLLVLVSPERLLEFEAEMSKLAKPGESSTALELPESAKLRLRGIGGLAHGPAPTPGSASGTRLFELAERLAAPSETVEGPWLRRIDLENP
jgi:hypothetical protein